MMFTKAKSNLVNATGKLLFHIRTGALMRYSMVILLVGGSGFAQDNVTSRVNVLNGQLRQHIQAKRFKDALNIAESLVKLIETSKGPGSLDASIAYSNIGSINRMLEQYKDAAVSFSKALEIRRTVAPDNLVDQIPLYESIAFCLDAAGKAGEAQQYYTTALELLEKTENSGSRGAFPLTLGAAANASKRKDFVRAYHLYKQAAILAYHHFEVDSLERVELLESHTCHFVSGNPPSDLLDDFRRVEAVLRKRENDSKGIVHGKLETFVAPNYSPFARVNRLSGRVFVRVSVNTEGKVIRAKTICSNAVLGKSAEAAALTVLFSPTTKHGTAIPIEGLITYDFDAPK